MTRPPPAAPTLAAARFLLVALWLPVALSAPGLATPATDAFTAGRFAEAVRLGQAGGSAEDRIAAARAASVIATYQTTSKAEARRILEQALADAEAAVALAPGSTRAELERAIIAGYLAKVRGAGGLARRTREALEAVIAREPDNALAHAILGGLHGETVATVGPFLARTAVGARRDEAVRHFDRALALDGASVLYPTFYALTLLQLGERNAPRATELLMKADRNTPRDAYDRLVQANGRKVLAALRTGDTRSAVALAAELSPLGRVSS